MKQILAISVYGLWCLGAAIEGTDTGTVVQICAAVLIGVIGFLIRNAIGSMQKSIDEQGKRLRKAEQNVIRIATRRGVHIPHDNEDQDES